MYRKNTFDHITKLSVVIVTVIVIRVNVSIFETNLLNPYDVLRQSSNKIMTFFCFYYPKI